MRRSVRYQLLFTLYLLGGLFIAKGQSGFYVPKQGKVFFKNDTATVFSNVINHGQLGVGQNAVLNFSGTVWENAPDAMITDESNGGSGTNGNGGWVRFLSAGQRQQLIGGYNAATKTGAIFQNFQLLNPFGVELQQSSTKISKRMEFKTGLFYLTDQMLVIGNNDPGKIIGYDSSRYFVTSGNAGLLFRENIRSSDGWVTFPVGSKEFAYTPAALRSNSTQGDDYYASVTDGVQSGLFAGNFLLDESVNKTWQMGKRFRPGQDEVEIALQHLNVDEGGQFRQHRSKAYVAQFSGGHWDVGYPQMAPLPGTLTSTGFLGNSGVNSRVFSSVGSSSYFTKLTGDGDTTRMRLWFDAYRLDKDNVYVYWTTKPEVNIKYFIVQRRLSSEPFFKNIATVNSKALNGFSSSQLYYDMINPNNYTGVSYYRLISVDFNNAYTYHNIVAVGGVAGKNETVLWPNPSKGLFYIAINTQQEVRKLILWNSAGQKVMEMETNGLRVVTVPATHLIPGTYFVSLISRTGAVLETKKIVIANK